MTKDVSLPIDAVVGINYVCNSRCIMCNIWKNKDEPEIPPEEFLKLPSSLKDVNISGGETFLRTDIPDVVAAITKACPDARQVISTNGFTPALIERQMKKILEINPHIGVAISVDGVGEKHEEIRRIPDAYNKCIETLERLQSLGMTNLRFGFTIIPENVDHFSRVYEDAMSRGIEFTHSYAQSSENYFGDIHVMNDPDERILKQEYRKIITGELKSWDLKRWARAFYAYSLYRFITEKKQTLNNDPGSKFFFMGSDGTVYPSVVHNFPMGNITETDTWEDLWYSNQAHDARELVRTKGAPAWMICTARSAIRQHPFAVGSWILKSKLFGVDLPG
jgi:MoaA/NifB/PqqE/SkfB family radical SAM enzyme